MIEPARTSALLRSSSTAPLPHPPPASPRCCGVHRRCSVDRPSRRRASRPPAPLSLPLDLLRRHGRSRRPGSRSRLRPARGRPASERPAHNGGRAAEIGEQAGRDTVGMDRVGTVIFTPGSHVRLLRSLLLATPSSHLSAASFKPFVAAGLQPLRGAGQGLSWPGRRVSQGLAPSTVSAAEGRPGASSELAAVGGSRTRRRRVV